MKGIRQQLEDALSGRPKSPAEAERAAKAAEALAAYLRLEANVERLLAPDGRPPPHGAQNTSSLEGLTLHEAAQRVLEQAAVPLHVKELGNRIKAGGWKHKRSPNARPDQIRYQLAARLPRHPDVFIRVSPNTFGLVGWGSEPSPPPKPRVGLFGGGKKPTGRDLGSHPEAPATAGRWRSS
jgi:hypothetical protein